MTRLLFYGERFFLNGEWLEFYECCAGQLLANYSNGNDNGYNKVKKKFILV